MSGSPIYRRSFLERLGTGSLGAIMAGGFAARTPAAERPGSQKKWEPVSDRKIRFGIVGYGVCRFGAAFGFQNHPNVEVVAVSDLIPQRRNGLMKACRCDKSYESLEVLVKDPKIKAVFTATDAPNHAQKSHLPYHESDRVLNIAYNALCEGRCLEDIELRRNDETFLDELGTQRIPDPTTAGDFCRGPTWNRPGRYRPRVKPACWPRSRFG